MLRSSVLVVAANDVNQPVKCDCRNRQVCPDGEVNHCVKDWVAHDCSFPATALRINASRMELLYGLTISLMIREMILARVR